MKPSLSGIIVGLGIAIVLKKLLPPIALRIQPTPYSLLVMAYLIPLLIGTFMTGVHIGKNGWKYGLLVALLYIVYDIGGTLIEFGGHKLLRYMLPNAQTLIRYLLTGCLGGYLGQLLAQKRHKKSVC